MFIYIFCLCPVGITVKLNFDMLKVIYWLSDKSREHITDSFGACTARDASDKAETHVEDHNTIRNWVTPP